MAAGVLSLTARPAWKALAAHYEKIRELHQTVIPYVEAVLRAEIPQARYRLIPVKFVGGVLSMCPSGKPA